MVVPVFVGQGERLHHFRMSEMKDLEERLKQDGIVFYGTNWCLDCKRAKKTLDQRGVAYHFVNIDRDREARAYVQEVNKGNRSVPTIVFPDGEILVEPSNEELAKKLGDGFKA